MRFNKALRLRIYVLSDQESEAQKLGINLDELKFEDNLRDFYFYSIDFVVKYKQDKRMSSFGCSGQEFYTNVSVDKLIETIDEHRRNDFN